MKIELSGIKLVNSKHGGRMIRCTVTLVFSRNPLYAVSIDGCLVNRTKDRTDRATGIVEPGEWFLAMPRTVYGTGFKTYLVKVSAPIAEKVVEIVKNSPHAAYVSNPEPVVTAVDPSQIDPSLKSTISTEGENAETNENHVKPGKRSRRRANVGE